MARILVVDDDEALRGWLYAILRNDAHEVLALDSGEQLFAQLQGGVPDLLLLDVLLPGANGMQIVQRLRAEPATASLPVILITSLDPRRYMRQGMELGADDFLVKPLSAPEVIKAVNARLERHAQTLRRHGAGSAQEGAPTQIGGYRLERLLARGVTAEVYYARHAVVREREAAVKLFRSRSRSDTRQLERFLREVEIASAVQHPHLATVYDQGVEQGALYVAFEYFERGDLAGLIGAGLAPAPARKVVEHVAQGLGALHAAGIVHRDIKPANIMVRGGSDFVIADFGLAKLLEQNISLTATGEVLGTPAYLAPEQAMGGALGPWTDIYGLGVVLYELLTGDKPFPGGNHQAIVFKHLHTAPPALPAQVAAFQPVLDRMLAKDPAERYGSTGDLLAALAALPLAQ
jgi:serine/threonine protein kinase/CheY-like chemotaxis protein